MSSSHGIFGKAPSETEKEIESLESKEEYMFLIECDWAVDLFKKKLEGNKLTFTAEKTWNSESRTTIIGFEKKDNNELEIKKLTLIQTITDVPGTIKTTKSLSQIHFLSR